VRPIVEEGESRANGQVSPGLFPPSPSKGSPNKRRRADTLDRQRQATPSPTRRRRQMEDSVPSPIKRVKELVNEEMEEEEADDQDVAAICALGFDREMAIEALEQTVRV
jgi:hypothetical protein